MDNDKQSNARDFVGDNDHRDHTENQSQEQSAAPDQERDRMPGPSNMAAAPSPIQPVATEPAMSSPLEAHPDHDPSAPANTDGPPNPLDVVGRTETVFQKPEPAH